jgi:hypothetical protein
MVLGEGREGGRKGGGDENDEAVLHGILPLMSGKIAAAGTGGNRAGSVILTPCLRPT